MYIATVVLSVILAALLVFSGIGKLRHDPKQMGVMKAINFPEDQVWWLAIIEFIGALGLLLGLWAWPIGLAAVIGVIMYFIGALIFHLRAHDKNIGPAIVIIVLAVVTMVMRLTSI